MSIIKTSHAQPIAAFEFSQMMENIGFFESAPSVAVATSGGSDSMALLLLTQDWAAERGGKVIALTVDHNLRPESRQEAECVSQWCNKRGIEHHVLMWTPPAAPGSLQARARDARYQLLSEWCKQRDVLHLLLGHHRDDQAETLFIRLAHGSQLTGLSCISQLSIKNGVRVLRPLLFASKQRLIATLSVKKQPWLEDPSNTSKLYTRNSLRGQLNHCADYRELAERTASLADAFGRLRNALEQMTARHLADTVEIFPSGHAAILLPRFISLPPQIALSILGALVLAVSGTPYPPRTKKLHRFYDQLSEAHFRRGTFAGCLFSLQQKEQKISVIREPNASTHKTVLSINRTVYWDKRFRVRLTGEASFPLALSLHALGKVGAIQFKKYAPDWHKRPEKQILPVLPSCWLLDELAAAPHMAYCPEKFRHISFSFHYNPMIMLAGPCFFRLNNSITL